MDVVTPGSQMPETQCDSFRNTRCVGYILLSPCDKTLACPAQKPAETQNMPFTLYSAFVYTTMEATARKME